MSTLTITALQSSLYWLDKDANLAMFNKQLEAITHQPDLILLPETFSTGFAINLDCAEPENGKVLTWLKAQAHKHNAVIAGSVLVAQGDKKANRFYWVKPDGEVSYYDKRHLFRLGSEGDYVVAGQARKVFEINYFAAANMASLFLQAVRAAKGTHIPISSVAGAAPLYHAQTAHVL